ncbi:MAG: M48 family metalloprotease [Sideroxydans sp.]|nr:M48 family metalloprotease [Sideroxydans sp.]
MLRSILVVVVTSLFLSACGTNPVTGKRELQFVSESQEIAMGQQNYGPARQQQGGDYVIDPELTAYVQSVGNKLAAVADRKLPYEFVVLNDSVPNAWAMPGGKIAFNRGLLYELNSEAELAAVLGHEIVHAAARHGAKSMESGMLLQGAVLATGIATQDKSYGNLAVGAAQLSSQLISTKYGRDNESESDKYGMLYMKRAGYDPRAAVTLQETFVRLSKGQQSDFISGLFASHPPSEERVAANKVTLAELGEGGEMGREIYAQKVGKLKATHPAYSAYDQGVQALSKGDTATATTLAKKAVAGEPREARFQELLGDISLTQKNSAAALPFYQRAIQMQPDYFRPHLQSGIALKNLGRNPEAEVALSKSNSLLPTAPAHALLGQLAETRGDTDAAMQNYSAAAGSDSSAGQFAAANLTRLDLPRNPGKYLKSGVQADAKGNLYAVVQNPTAVTISNVQVRVVQFDATTRQPVAQSQPLYIPSSIASNQQGNVPVGIRVASQQELALFQVQIVSAVVNK